MDLENESTLEQAMKGDINAFQNLFKTFHEELKSFLYRLMANRADAEDLAHDTFIKAFDKISTFKGASSLKTWVFQIATNLAYNELKKRKRWVEDVKTQAKGIVLSNPQISMEIQKVNAVSEFGKFEIREHIDTCFTCMAKNLPIESQVAIIIKEIYDFTLKEVMLILNKSEGQTKYLLQTGRNTLTDIFERRCALVNKQGVCNQCSELNGWFNPKQNQQEAKMKIQMVKKADKSNVQELFELRLNLVKNINPLNSEGHELQEMLLRCNRIAMGEVESNSPERDN